MTEENKQIGFICDSCQYRQLFEEARVLAVHADDGTCPECGKDDWSSLWEDETDNGKEWRE